MLPDSPEDRGRRVFLVHGRDYGARDALAALLKAFDLKVIPWRDAAAYAGGGTPYTGAMRNPTACGKTSPILREQRRRQQASASNNEKNPPLDHPMPLQLRGYLCQGARPRTLISVKSGHRSAGSDI